MVYIAIYHRDSYLSAVSSNSLGTIVISVPFRSYGTVHIHASSGVWARLASSIPRVGTVVHRFHISSKLAILVSILVAADVHRAVHATLVVFPLGYHSAQLDGSSGNHSRGILRQCSARTG